MLSYSLQGCFSYKKKKKKMLWILNYLNSKKWSTDCQIFAVLEIIILYRVQPVEKVMFYALSHL